MNVNLKQWGTLCAILFLFVACSNPQTSNDSAENVLEQEPAETTSLTELESLSEIAPVWAQTNGMPDGNKVIEGNGKFPDVEAIEIKLEGKPTWVVGVPYQTGALWVVTLEDGSVQAFSVVDQRVAEVELNTAMVPEGMPPLILLGQQGLQVVLPDGDFSPLTNPIFINDPDHLAYINQTSQLVIEEDGEQTVLDINAQLDARILADENGRLLVNIDPTNRYAHAIMGDDLEAAGLALIETDPTPKVIRTIPISEEFVMEAISPLWVDLDGDGEREIIVTRANRDQGAQIVVLNEMGELVAEGPAIGTGNRWRHQLAVAPFGPNGEMELVEVRTPHIGGPTGFFRWEGNALTKVTDERGFTSHMIRSRNLDMAIAGKFDASGRMTIILPSQDRTILGGIQHLDDGAETVWTLPLPDKLITNIGAVHLENDEIGLAVGLEDGTLKIWQD